MNIIAKLKKANLKGRGGAGFPTWLKWDMVKKAKGKDKYVVCNLAEGEPGVLKDKYILENYPEKMIDGIMIAIEFLKAREGIIYINPDYYKIFGNKLRKIIKDRPIKLFRKPREAGYIGGEETSVLNAIEGKRIEPRLRPPFPPEKGLWGCPTLVNNTETFYDVSLIACGKYKNKRFYTISGDCLWDGVYEFSEDWTIEKILKESGNYPDFEFFVQVGGDASGEVLNSRQLKRKATGAASITIYSITKHNPLDLLNKWINFFVNQSCGQCTPCREGVYRLRELINSLDKNYFHYDLSSSKKLNFPRSSASTPHNSAILDVEGDFKYYSVVNKMFPEEIFALIEDLLNNLRETAFCGLGGAVPIPIQSYIDNVLKNK